MNEELSIIINAITDGARKNIQGIKKELGGLGKEGGKSSMALGKAFKAVGVGAAAAVGAIVAVTTALVSLADNTKQYRQEQAKLNAAFLAAGSTTEQAQESYKNLYRFLGDGGKATEAAAHLAKLTTNEKELAQWTTALQGVYASFGDSLPIEGLTEAANETAKVGKVTGTLADALNWAGISEDAFNEQLALTNSEAEREALIRNTLNSTYAEAAALYEKNNAELIAQNEAQARLEATTGRLGKATQPLQTAFTNLSNSLLTALEPAISAVSKALTWLINAVSKAVEYVKAFFGIMGGKSDGIAAGVADAATGAGALSSGFDAATASAEKLKRSTMGFDELNVVSDNSSGNAAGGLGSGTGAGAVGGFSLDTSGVTDALDNTTAKFDSFVEKIKSAIDKLKEVFAPTISAFKDFGLQVGGAITESLPSFQEGLEGYKTGFGDIFTYLTEEFIPNFVNSWSENLLPILGDTTAFGIEELGKNFEFMGTKFQEVTEDIIKPALETFETMATDAMETVGSVWDEKGEELLNNLSEAFEGIRQTFDDFYKEVIKPVAETIIEWVNKIWEENLKPLWDDLVEAVLDIANELTIFWNKVLKPIIDWILQKIYPVVKQVIDNILAVMQTLISTVSGVIQGIIQVIKGIIQFIVGVFTGDWKKAWDGIKNIIGGVWKAIWSVIKGIINLIIDGINSLWGGIYQAVKGIVDTIGDIAGVIGKLLGQDWGFSMPDKPPKIPKLATGGIVVSETLARIGEGGKKEAVLPLEQNTDWMDLLADKIAARGAAPTKIVLQLNEKELGWANINSINNITRQTGTLQLNLV